MYVYGFFVIETLRSRLTTHHCLYVREWKLTSRQNENMQSLYHRHHQHDHNRRNCWVLIRKQPEQNNKKNWKNWGKSLTWLEKCSSAALFRLVNETQASLHGSWRPDQRVGSGSFWSLTLVRSGWIRSFFKLSRIGSDRVGSPPTDPQRNSPHKKYTPINRELLTY